MTTLERKGTLNAGLKTGLKFEHCANVVGEALLNMQNGRPVTGEQYEMLNYLLAPVLEGLHPNKIPGGRREGRPRKIMPDPLAVEVHAKRKKSTKDKATETVANKAGMSADTVRGRYERADTKAIAGYAKTARKIKAVARIWERNKNSR